MRYEIPVVFRVTRRGDWKGSLDVVYANVREFGLETANSGDRYSNDWYRRNLTSAKYFNHCGKLVIPR